MSKTTPYQNLTVLIAEDDINARETLKSMVELDFKYVYEAEDGCEAVELSQKHKPDIILMDIQMPCMSGLEALSEIRKSSADTLVIFISAYNEVQILLQAIDLKVDAYIIKPFLYKDVLEKIDANLCVTAPEGTLHGTLSKREYEVFVDISKGVKPLDIARKYGLKAKTVGTYRKRILEKLHMKSNAEIIRYALSHHLI